MGKVVSKDGTQIAYETKGEGQPVILVDGAMCFRAFGPMGHLSDLLAPHFKVYIYDRRGRGESSDTQPFSVQREVEDIEALIQETGGSAFVFGTSSGACLALEAASQLGSKIKKLALYEPPYNLDRAAQPEWEEYWTRLHEFVAADKRGDAVELFMRFAGTPAEQIEAMRQSPVWPTFESIAPTLTYDAADIGEDRFIPTQRAANIHTPTLIMDGGESMVYMPFMHTTAMALANAIPNSQQRTLEGQTHNVNLEVLAAVLIEFFSK